MPPGNFTKHQATETRQALIDIHHALPHAQQIEFITAFSHALDFLNAAWLAAPEEPPHIPTRPA